jgi:pimeloyl-ACP methyl ester carboxylesterase
MERLLLEYEGSAFSYLKGGSGKKVLLCLHGFGEEATTFSFLEHHLGNNFTIYALDFPWHGHTERKKTLTFPAKELIQILKQMIDDYERKKIHLFSYSMGGRVGLSLLQLISNKIEKAVFLAPDGLKISFWYWLATQTLLGNGLFRITMQHPQWFMWLIVLSKRFNIINASVFKFVHTFLADKKVRDDLYRIWTTMRKFHPTLEHVKQQIRTHQIPVHLVFGEFDRVILSENGYKFQKGLEAFVHVDLWKSGHQLLKEKHAGEIIRLLE